MARIEEFDDIQLDVEFTQAGTRSNLTSKENIAILFGKIAKWYEALVPTGGSSGQFLGFNSSGTAKWVSNPNTDQKVKATKLAQSTADASYYPTLVAGEGTAGVSIFDSAKINHTTGTTSIVGNTRLVLGNSTNEGTTNNEEGLLRIYSPGTKYHTLKGAKITTDNVEHTLPTTGGTILNTGTTSFTQTLSSGTKIGTIKINGTSSDIYAPTDTDTKVTDTVGTANTYYPAGGTSTSTATGTQVFDTSLKFIGTTGSTSAVGKAQLVLGNATASGTANNKQGSIVVYGSTAYAHTIQGAPTAARTLTLPDKTGTFALTSDIPSVPTVNDAALTLKGAGTTVTTFTANASSAKSLDIVAGSNVTVTADATNAKISIASSHPTITKSTDTTSTASPAHGGTFTVVDSITREANGHVTKINTKTVTLPADSNTDTKVTQSATTTTNYRPILFGAKNSTDVSTLADTITDQAYTSTKMFAKPDTGILYASAFSTSGYTNGTGAQLNQYGLYLKSYKSASLPAGGDYSYSRYALRAYDGKATDNAGMLLTMDGGGLTIVGGGESATALANLISDDQRDSNTSRTRLNVGGTLNTAFSASVEQLILSSDNNIYFLTKCNTIADRKPVVLDTNSYFYPGTTKTGSIGTSSYMWNSVYAASIYENGTSLASKYAAIGHTHTTTIAADSGTNQLTLAASTKYKLTTGGTNFIFTTPPNTTYSAGNHLTLSGTTFKVADYCKNLNGGDWNTVTTNGWYMGSECANAPSTAWWIGHVHAHNNKYCIQELWNFDVVPPDTAKPDAMFMGHKMRWFRNSAWGPWVDVSTPTPSAKVDCDWGTVASRTTNVTRGWMAYWNGAYNGSTSNLTYCNRGAFGTIVTKSTTDYSKVTSSTTNGKIKIDGTDTTVYAHPSYTSKTSGLYKITVDTLGHVSATASVAKGDIPALDYLPSTTKYAGSSSVGGAATSADKLTTARTITLGNDFQGSTSFDGSANITISGAHYRTGSSGQNTANYPWHRIAYCSGKSGKFSDTDAVIDIWKTYDGGGYGRIKISLRTNAAGAACSASAKWIYRCGFAIDDIKIARWGVTGESVYADVFLKCETYPRANIVQIHGNRAWTLVSSNEVSNTTSSDKKDSVEVYATIESAGTELHNQAYTEIKSAEDAAYTRGVTIPRTGSSTDANSFAGKNLVVFNEWNGTSTNNTPTAHYYHILRAQGNDTKYGTQLALGMNTNGIYYRNYNNENWLDWQALGRFTATPTSGRVVVTDGTTGGIKSSAYTIAKSVPSDAVFTDTVTTVTTSGSGNAVTSITASNGALTVTKGSTFSLDGHDNKCTVTNGSATSTDYGIVFAVNPNTTENNTLRKTNDFRYQMKNGSANTEGFATIVLGNTKKLSEADNKSGRIYLYSSGGYNHLITTTSTTSNVTHTLPATTGTILNSGTTSFTQSVSSGTKIGSIKINGTSTDIYTDNKVKQGNTQTGNYRPVMLGTTNNSDPSALNVDVTGQAYVTTSIYAKPVDGILYANTFTGDLSGNASSATQVYGTLTNPTTSTNYPIPFHTGASSANKSLLNNNGLSYTTLEGTASAVGYGILCVGNKTDSGTAGNKYGIVRIYPKTGSKYGQLKVADTMTGDRTYTLPDKTGTVAMTSDTQFLKTGISYDDSSTLTSKPWHKFAEVTITAGNTDTTITFMVSKTWGSATSYAGILSAHLRTGSTKVCDIANTQLQWNVANEGINPSNFVMVIIDTANTSSKVELWCKYQVQYDGWIFSVIKDHSRKARTTSWSVFSTNTAGSATYTAGTSNPIVSSLPYMQGSTFDGEITTLAFLNRIYDLYQTPSGAGWNGNETLITSIPSASGTSSPNYQRVKTIDFIKDCISGLKEPVLYENTINPQTSTTINLPNGIPKYLKVFIGVEYSSDGSTYTDTSACINCIDVDMAHTRHGGFIGYDTPGPSGVGNYLAYCYVNVTQNTGSTTAYTVGISYANFLNLSTSTTVQNVIARIVKIIAVY